MNIAVLGSGGRECAIGWKLFNSKKTKKLFFIPGNGGTSDFGQNIDISLDNFESIYIFIKNENIDLVIVGPEAPLVEGIVDFFEEKMPELSIIGPSKKGAMLEGSKSFAKNFMQRHNIPTAKFKSFEKEELTQAIEFLKEMKPPYVLKADGLAAGKGVLIINDLTIAIEELTTIFSGKFGNAGDKVVIEQFIDGIELSVFVITDGTNYKILPSAKDYKRIRDNNTGPNTGGMGAVSPVPFATDDFMTKIENKIIKPTIDGLKKEEIKYKGFIFFGLIKVDNEPFVIEYNARLGDPETQAILPRIETDLVDLFISTATNKLDTTEIKISEKYVTAVVVASGGYPESYEKNYLIEGLDTISDCTVFQAGTKKEDNKTLTSGGRVLVVSAADNDIIKARNKVYDNIQKIHFKKMYYRKDIGLDLI